MSDNFRHAQYDETGLQIDDPQLLTRGSSTTLVLSTTLWSARPAASSCSGQIRLFDLENGTKPILLRSDGTNWRVLGPTLVARNTTLLAGTNVTGEQYLGNIWIPGGLLFVGAMVEWRQGFARSDTTDTMSATSQRIGPTGTIADTQHSRIGYAAMSSTTRNSGLASVLRVTATPAFIKEGTANSTSSSWGAGTSAPAYQEAGATLDLANPIYFGASVTLVAATGTTLPQVTNQELWMLP